MNRMTSARRWAQAVLVLGGMLWTAPALGQEGGWIQTESTDRVDKAALDQTYVVDVRALNVRADPSTQDPPVGTVQRGAFVRKLEETFNDREQREWYRVQQDGGGDGWVASEFLVAVRDHLRIVEGAVAFAHGLAAPAPDGPSAALDSIRAGFVYVGPVGDAGWTYQHDLGRQALEQLPGVASTSYLESVPEEDALTAAAIDQLVADGNNLIFTTSYGYMDQTIEAAKRFEDVVFMHASGFKTAPNAGTYFGRMYQARYLAGILAGGMTQSGILGYVAAFPIPEVIRGINAFALGAQSVNPEVEVQVLWTDTWYGPGIEREMAERLLDHGADVLTMHQDSPAVVQAAEQRGKLAIGYHSDMSAFAPNAILTSAVWDWSVIYLKAAEDLKAGRWTPDQIWWGLKEGVVDLAPLSPRVPGELVDDLARRREDLIEGRLRVFEGPIRDSRGFVQVPSGQVLADADLLTMDYFVLGVKGELPPPSE